MSDSSMQQIAKSYGHESGFILPAPPESDCDLSLRFWVPNHEMEMCGHATARIWTRSGAVEAKVAHVEGSDRQVEVSRPIGRAVPLHENDDAYGEILPILGITSDDLAPFDIQNANTSRIKTLVPLKSTIILNGLQPDFARIEQLNDTEGQVFEARQFPKSSGYPEDPATAIAAALAFGLWQNGLVETSSMSIIVRQGEAMGKASKIDIRFRLDEGNSVFGCWLGGSFQLVDEAKKDCFDAQAHLKKFPGILEFDTLNVYESWIHPSIATDLVKWRIAAKPAG